MATAANIFFKFLLDIMKATTWFCKHQKFGQALMKGSEVIDHQSVYINYVKIMSKIISFVPFFSPTFSYGSSRGLGT